MHLVYKVFTHLQNKTFFLVLAQKGKKWKPSVNAGYLKSIVTTLTMTQHISLSKNRFLN